MTPRETMIKEIARSICRRLGLNPDMPKMGLFARGIENDVPNWLAYRSEATAALDAYHATLPALGLRVVPVEPERAMWAEGGDVIVNNRNQHHDRILSLVWVAMLAAATNPLEARDE